MSRTRLFILTGALASCVVLLLLRDRGDSGDDSRKQVVRAPVQEKKDTVRKKTVRSDVEVRHKAVLALALIESGKESDRMRGVALLREIGAPAMALLKAELANEEGGAVRYAAAFAVAILGDQDCVLVEGIIIQGERRFPSPVVTCHEDQRVVESGLTDGVANGSGSRTI